MNVHDQLSRARHEEPLRAAARSRREAQVPLAGLTLGLDTALALSAGQPDLRQLLNTLKAETQRAITDLRRVIYGLRPSALDGLGLAGSCANR